MNKTLFATLLILGSLVIAQSAFLRQYAEETDDYVVEDVYEDDYESHFVPPGLLK